MTDSTHRVWDQLEPGIEQAVVSADASVERVGDQLERAISSAILRRARRRRTRVVLAALAPAAAAGVALAAYQPWATGPRFAASEVVASSSLIEIVRVTNPSGERSGCFEVEGRAAVMRTGVPHTTICTTGGMAQFETHALVAPGGTTAFYGRARIPGAVRVVLEFPGRNLYRVDLQRDGFWAWDPPSSSLARDRRRLLVLALDAKGHVLARDTQPAARETA